jgi:dTMP kinase
MRENPDGVVVLDRYMSSNPIYQGANIEDEDEMRRFFWWSRDFETRMLGLPEADMTVLLDLPVHIGIKLLKERGRKLDIHEKDKDFLERCRKASKAAAEFGHWIVVRCEDESGKGIRSEKSIADEVYALAEPLLKSRMIP